MSARYRDMIWFFEFSGRKKKKPKRCWFCSAPIGDEIKCPYCGEYQKYGGRNG